MRKKFLLPKISIEQKEFILRALYYYRIASVEFSFDNDDVIFCANNIIELIQYEAKVIVKNNKKKFLIPKLSIEQKDFMIKTLEYYRLSSVQFEFFNKENIYTCNNIIELIQTQTKTISVKE